MPFLNYHDPVLFTDYLEQAVAPVMSARQTATRVREHLTSDKNSAHLWIRNVQCFVLRELLFNP